ncbi:DNA-binding protein, partial [uncultured Desulfovibrio sp.]
MVTLKESYITQECRELLGITVVSVLRRAEKEHWQFRPRKGRGGGKEWLLASMPQATQ